MLFYVDLHRLAGCRLSFMSTLLPSGIRPHQATSGGASRSVADGASDRDEIPATFPQVTAWLQSSPPVGEAKLPPMPAVPFADLWYRVATPVVDELAAPEATVRADLTADLVGRLSSVGEAVLWAEFNEQRTPRDIVIEHLRPDGPHRKLYNAFLEELRADGLRALTARYPVLRCNLAKTVCHWREASKELLVRVQEDRGVLMDAFGVHVEARLVGVRPGLSDPHRGGRTVAALTFARGDESRTVVYKPKDLVLDHAFQQLLAKLPPPTPADRPLRSAAVVARDGYGYMEWLPHVPCRNNNDLQRFYRNAGRLAALLYLLGCADCHHENFIAQRDDLLLVDAEALFQGTPYDRNTDRRNSTVRSALYDRMGDSVMRLGLLPQWHFAGEKRVPQDVSALGIAPPRSLRQQVAGWQELNTDGMISGRVERAAVLPTSSPVGIGEPNRLSEFAGDFCGGFNDQLAAVASDKRRWLAAGGYLYDFRQHRSRFVRRPTWVYLWAIRQQNEPEALTSEAGQQQVRAKLGRGNVPFVARPADPRVVAAENDQLGNLDVPFFEQLVAGTSLISPSSPEIPGYFEASGYDNARRRVEQLDAEAINLQLALVRGVIAAKGMRAHVPGQPGLAAAAASPAGPSGEERLNEAAEIGDLLVSAAISDDTGAVEWLGIDVAEDIERSSYGPLGLSLYAGRTGIALFLAALASAGAARRADYIRVAAGACSDLSRLCDELVSAQDGRGWWREQSLGIAGGGGVLLALVHLRKLLPTLVPQADRITAFLLDALDPDELARDEQLDVIFGSAGLIGPLLTVGTPQALTLARAAGDALVTRQDGSGGWITKSSETRALTGFSHGASGMVAALTRLHARTQNGAYLNAAAAGVRWERRQYSPEAANWPDLRPDAGQAPARFMLSWCHGAPGIALARLCLMGTPLWDADTARDLLDALKSTANGVLPEDSLCCGGLGRAAILRTAAWLTGEHRWLEAAARVEATCLERKRTAGTYSFKDVHGLFQGSAGAGLALLDTKGRFLPGILSGGLLSEAKASVKSNSSK